MARNRERAFLLSAIRHQPYALTFTRYTSRFTIGERCEDVAGGLFPRPAGSNAQIFREPQLRFLEDIFQAAETGKGKLTDGHGADFADRRFLQRRAAAFFMDQNQHKCVLLSGSNHQLPERI